MQVVSEEVSAGMTTVTIKYGEEGTLGPAIAFFLRRLLHVKNDRYSVLIVVAHNTLIRVCSIGLYDTVFLHRVLSRLEVRQLNMR